jgi:hypothetical protein
VPSVPMVQIFLLRAAISHELLLAMASLIPWITHHHI